MRKEGWHLLPGRSRGLRCAQAGYSEQLEVDVLDQRIGALHLVLDATQLVGNVGGECGCVLQPEALRLSGDGPGKSVIGCSCVD